MKTRSGILVAMILAVAVTRLLPFPYHTVEHHNFSSIAAMALFGGATFSNKRLAFLVPFAGLFLSDLVIGFYDQMPIVYGSFALIVGIGWWIRSRRRIGPITVAALGGSILFFILTNFGVWAFETLYPKNLTGLVACYTAAIPFFRNTLTSDLFYTVVLFGGFATLERLVPALREGPVAIAP